MACPYAGVVYHLCISNVKGECNSPLRRIYETVSHYRMKGMPWHAPTTHYWSFQHWIYTLHITHYTLHITHYTITHYTLHVIYNSLFNLVLVYLIIILDYINLV